MTLWAQVVLGEAFVPKVAAIEKCAPGYCRRNQGYQKRTPIHVYHTIVIDKRNECDEMTQVAAFWFVRLKLHSATWIMNSGQKVPTSCRRRCSQCGWKLAEVSEIQKNRCKLSQRATAEKVRRTETIIPYISRSCWGWVHFAYVVLKLSKLCLRPRHARVFPRPAIPVDFTSPGTAEKQLFSCQVLCLVPIPRSIRASHFAKMTVTPIEFPDNADYKNQSIAVPGTKRPGQTGASTFHLRIFC